MQWFEEIAEILEPETIYTHALLIDFIQAHYTHVSKSSYHWGISGMIKCGKLAKIGYDQYRKADGTEREYTPIYTKTTQTLIKRIMKAFPDTAFTVFETELLNEFLEIPVSESFVSIQVERAVAETVFRYLLEHYHYHILLRPSEKDYDIYKRSGCVIISNLLSESPLKYGHPHIIRIEKMLVDAYCDKIIRRLLDQDAMTKLFYQADKRYTIDKPGLLRYAKRRGKKEEIAAMASEIFEHERSIENKIIHDKFMIQFEVSSIVGSLPESQQLLFEYIQGGMTQPQLKNALGVTPQAVDQRLKRLFRTIARELDIRLGFSEDYIRKIYFYKSEFHILRRMADC